MFLPLGSFHSLTRALGSWLTSLTEAEVIWGERKHLCSAPECHITPDISPGKHCKPSSG